MANEDDKSSGANNSGSEGGVLPQPLTSLERLFNRNPPGTTGILDGKIIPPPNPDGILPEPRNMIGFVNGGTFLFSGPDESNAGARTYSADTNISNAITPPTDFSRGSFSPQSLSDSSGGSGGGPRPNPLNEYVNYTYGITLYAAKTNEYTPGTVSGEVIIASGGRRENRNANFREDFYFENFKLESIIGLNSKSRSSNVITAEFTVIEPYGMTLMDRILDLANGFGVQNWYEMLFTLQVDFHANDESGGVINSIPGATKYFQVGLIGCDIKVGSKGAEYKFTAIPFSHHAYQQTVGTTPAMFEANGETVGEIFDSEAKGSFCKALNDFHQEQVKKENYGMADIYKFEIAGSISSAKIVTNKDNEIKSSPMPGDSAPISTADALGKTKSGQPIPLVLNKQRFPVNAGTSIIDFINLVVRSSTYVENQMKPGGGGDGTMKWFKIVPEIKYGEFDTKRNTHQKTITYHVIEYVIYNTKFVDAPVKQPPQSQWSKEYNWIYTGLNQEILDFNVDFNTMFYTMMTSDKEKLAKEEVKPNNDENAEEKNNKGSGTPEGKGTIAPLRKNVFAGNAPLAGQQQGKNDTKKTASNDFYNSLMSSSRGDMINVQLKIAGDPEFVKQDDIYYGPNQGSGDSLNMDTEEVYVSIFFRTPTDLDQETGQMDFNTYPSSVFSGIYRVLKVDSTFERGQFIQNLDCIRLFGESEVGGSSAGERSGNDSLGNARSQALGRANQRSLEMMNTSGMDVRAEDGSLSLLKRNPETGELYDPGPIDRRSTGPIEGNDEAEAARETRSLLNRYPPNRPATNVSSADTENIFFG
jgi:hypothetical protein